MNKPLKNILVFCSPFIYLMSVVFMRENLLLLITYTCTFILFMIVVLVNELKQYANCVEDEQ